MHVLVTMLVSLLICAILSLCYVPFTFFLLYAFSVPCTVLFPFFCRLCSVFCALCDLICFFDGHRFYRYIISVHFLLIGLLYDSEISQPMPQLHPMPPQIGSAKQIWLPAHPAQTPQAVHAHTSPATSVSVAAYGAPCLGAAPARVDMKQHSATPDHSVTNSEAGAEAEAEAALLAMRSIQQSLASLDEIPSHPSYPAHPSHQQVRLTNN